MKILRDQISIRVGRVNILGVGARGVYGAVAVAVVVLLVMLVLGLVSEM